MGELAKKVKEESNHTIVTRLRGLLGAHYVYAALDLVIFHSWQVGETGQKKAR